MQWRINGIICKVKSLPHKTTKASHSTTVVVAASTASAIAASAIAADAIADATAFAAVLFAWRRCYIRRAHATSLSKFVMKRHPIPFRFHMI